MQQGVCETRRCGTRGVRTCSKDSVEPRASRKSPYQGCCFHALPGTMTTSLSGCQPAPLTPLPGSQPAPFTSFSGS
eukprot:119163-Pelagomonas_calceolata.AAC.2